jgi:signal transduction histidine kinase
VSITAYLKKDEKTSEHPPDKASEFIEVSISDTGPGIPAESIKSIFDKFKKLQRKGSGLGLHIARQIVTAHGGDIWVKSEQEMGSTFSFTVPVF